MEENKYRMFNCLIPLSRRKKPYWQIPHLTESYEHYDRHYSRLKKQPVNRKTHYYIMSGYDIALHLWFKFGDRRVSDDQYFSHRLAWKALRKQTFLKRVYVEDFTDYLSGFRRLQLAYEANHFVGFSVSKQKVEKWFKQNMYRFLIAHDDL